MPEKKLNALKRAASAVAGVARRAVGRPKSGSPTPLPAAEPLDASRAAVERQLAFEKKHPVPYAADQRARAARQRFVLAVGREPSSREDAEIHAWLADLTGKK
jgi:hypothetical protein